MFLINIFYTACTIDTLHSKSVKWDRLLFLFFFFDLKKRINIRGRFKKLLKPTAKLGMWLSDPLWITVQSKTIEFEMGNNFSGKSVYEKEGWPHFTVSI